MHSENNFTIPTERCLHPELWNANNAGATEIEVQRLFYGLVIGLQPDLVVEFGTYQGEMAETIGLALQKNGHGKLETMERDERSAVMARQRVAALPVTVISDDVKNFRGIGLVDLAWIDAGVDGVLALDYLFPFLRAGAIIGIHDSHQEAIREAYRATQYWNDFRTIELSTPRGLYLCEVV